MEIKIKTWALWALILFSLGLATDYFFFHVLFHTQNPNSATTPAVAQAASPTEDEDLSTDLAAEMDEEDAAASDKDNFLASLKQCAPEVAAQTIATPEALLEYLKKSVGIQTEEVTLENYHLTLPNGELRRLQLLTADNTNSVEQRELRFFKVDEEGQPDPIALKKEETLESLLAMGTVTRHEVKAQWLLKDSSSISVEKHNERVFELQYNNHGKVLSCRFKDCICPY
ncbi:MAG: hypothetical protein AAGB31_09140 [Bdellovibrio sp.]